jgi:outer membrane protein
MSTRARSALLVTALLAVPAAVRAQPAPGTGAAAPGVAAGSPAPGAIHLVHAVAALLENGTDVKLAGVDTQFARGTLLVAGEPFDTVLTSAATAAQEHPFTEPSPAGPGGPVEVRRVDFAAGLSKRFRAGVLVAPEVVTSRTMIEGDPGTTVAAASARLRVLVPLLRDLGGVLTEGPEQSARQFHAASLFEARHAAALGVLRAASAYWDYLAAQRRVQVFVGSEGRAERTAKETGALVKADERTRTDRVQAEGHLAASRANRITAEQDVVTAWEALATVIGVAAVEDVLAPPPAGTDFPAAAQSPSSESLQRWLAAAVSSRDDLQAAHRRVEGTRLAEVASRSELRPRLDLELNAGFRGQERDRGWDRFFAPLHEDIPGLDALAQLRFELPLPRSGARGRVTQAAALHERQQLLQTHLDRAIRNGVATAFESVRRSQLALQQSEEAVRLLEQTVESERQKFRLGFSTLFAVIQAEEQLTSALLVRIASQRSFAVALARLRYETGTVLNAPGAGEARPAFAQAVAAGLLLLP